MAQPTSAKRITEGQRMAAFRLATFIGFRNHCQSENVQASQQVSERRARRDADNAGLEWFLYLNPELIARRSLRTFSFFLPLFLQGKKKEKSRKPRTNRKGGCQVWHRRVGQAAAIEEAHLKQLTSPGRYKNITTITGADPPPPYRGGRSCNCRKKSFVSIAEA